MLVLGFPNYMLLINRLVFSFLSKMQYTYNYSWFFISFHFSRFGNTVFGIRIPPATGSRKYCVQHMESNLYSFRKSLSLQRKVYWRKGRHQSELPNLCQFKILLQKNWHFDFFLHNSFGKKIYLTGQNCLNFHLANQMSLIA